MSPENLTITGNYSDYDIFEEEKETMTENDNVWVKKKYIYMERESTVNYLQ